MKEWIDKISTVDAKSLNDIEKAINNLEINKISLPTGGTDGAVLVKNGSTVNWSTTIGDISAINSKFYSIANINKFLNGSSTTTAYNNLDSQFQTTSKYIIPAINENYNNLINHINDTNVHGIDSIKNQLQTNIDTVQSNVDVIDSQLSDVNESIEDINDQIADINSKLSTPTTPGSKIGLEDYKPKLYSLIQTGQESNKSGDNSVTFGDGNDSSNSKYSIVAGYHIITNINNDYLSIFGQELISDSNNELLVGKFNAPVANGKFVIGDGEVDNRKNLLQLDNLGNLKILDVFDLNDGNLNIKNSLITKDITADNITINNKLSLNDLKLVDLTVDNLLVNNDITANNLNLNNDISAVNLNLSEKITSKNIENSEKIITDSLETKSITIADGLNTLQLNPDSILVDNLTVNKNTNLKGNVAIVIDINDNTNKFSVSGPSEFNTVKTGDLFSNSIVCSNSVSISSNLKVSGRILDSEGNSGEAGQVLTSNGMDNFKWAAPQFQMPDVAKNLKDFGALYGIVQKSDVSKPNKSGYYSIVFGQNNDREKANYSITAGLDNKSNEVHNFTQLFGEGLISDNSSETLLGAYNKQVTNGALIIGNGTDNSNRTNLFELNKYGEIIVNDTNNNNILKLDKNSNLTINNKFTSDSIEVKNLKVQNGIDLVGVSLSFEDLSIKNLTVENKSTLKGEVELRSPLTSTSSIESNTLNVDSKITSGSLETALIKNTGVLNTVGIINTGNEEIHGALSLTGELNSKDNIQSTGNLTINDIKSNNIEANNIIANSLKTGVILDDSGTLDAKAGYILTVNSDNKTISWKPNAAIGTGIKNLLDYGSDFGLIQNSANSNTAGKASVVFGDLNNRSSSNFSITSGSNNSSTIGHDYTNIFGKGLITDCSHETLIGLYNKAVVDGAFIIGSGTNNSNRNNLFELDKFGALSINNGNTKIFKLDKDSNLTINNKFTSDSIEVKNLKVQNGIDLVGVSLSFDDLSIKNLTVENKSTLKGEVELKSQLTSISSIDCDSMNVIAKITSDSLDTTLINNTGVLNTVGIVNTGDEEISGKLTVEGEISNSNNIKSTGNLTINNIESNDIEANNIVANSLKTDIILDSSGTLDAKAGYILTVNPDNKTISWKPNAASIDSIKNLLDYGSNFGLIQNSANGNSAGSSSVVFGDLNSRSSSNFSITSGSNNSSTIGHDYTNIFGKGLITDCAHETLLGSYNKATTDGSFIIGNGTDNSNRNNLFELDKFGALSINNGNTKILKLDKNSNLTINNKFISDSIDVKNLKVQNGIDLTGLSLTFEDLNIKNLTVENKSTLKGEVKLNNKLISNSSIDCNSINVTAKITSDSLDTTLINNTGILNTVGIVNTGDEEISGKLIVEGEISNSSNIKSAGNLTINNIQSNDIDANNIVANSLTVDTILDGSGTLDAKAGYILTVNPDNKTISWKPNIASTGGIRNLLDYGSNFSLIQNSANGNSAGNSSVVFGDSNSRSSASYSITSGSNNSSSTGHNYTNVFGEGLFTDGAYETLLGKYNKPVNNGAFVIGNGTSTVKSNIMSLDFSGNLNINNKLTLTSGDLKVSDSIKSNSGLFEDLTVNNSITFNGSNFDLNSITVKDLSITDNLNVSASNSTFVNDVTIGQNLAVQNINSTGTIQTITLKATGSISAEGNISSKKNIISEGNISGLVGRFTNSLATNGDFEASGIKGSSLTINGNASIDTINCTSILAQSIIDSNNSTGSSGDVLSISQDGSKIIWTSLSSDTGASGLQNLLDYGPDTNYSLVQKTASSATNNSAGISSVVFGISNIRDKSAYSITSGKENYTAAAHAFTEVFGEQIVTDDSYEMILGKYNNAVANGAFVIGVGENDSNRKNLLELNKSGQLKINNGSTNLLTLDASGNLTIANRVSGGIATFETLTVTDGIEFNGDQITFRDLELDTLIVNTSVDLKCDTVNIEKNASISGTLTSNTGNFTNLTGNILSGTTCNLITINSDNITNSNLISTKNLTINENLTVGGNASITGTLNGNVINGTSGEITGQLNIKTAKLDQVRDHNNSLGGTNYFLSSDGQYTKWVQIDLTNIGGSGGSGTDYSTDITTLYTYIGTMQNLKSETCLDLVSAINEVYDKAFAPASESANSGVGRYYPDNDNPAADSGIIFSDYGNNMADGKYSASFGYQTKAMSDYQFVCGRQNIFDASALFVVGNGSGEVYSNACVVTGSGDIKIPGIIKNGTGSCNNGDILTAASNADGKLELKWDTVNNVTGIDSLKSRVDTLETNAGNISTLTSDVATLKTNYTTLEGRVATNETNITALQTDLGTAQSTISTLQTAIGDLTTSPTTDKTSIITIITELYGMITDLQTRVSALEGGGTPTPSPSPGP